ncbi:hypothetical protein BQ8482_570036 [Mesorhizobium delmotii]|uniref:Uncharacterized protein n=1 Tax=Mesorhizobium delmotii TaxID=1631247 RepID=A0A2P9AUY7_9HYPH|nr:hypothetical protein BQ8482_570036 [Mesorhizobium delmotii]
MKIDHSTVHYNGQDGAVLRLSVSAVASAVYATGHPSLKASSPGREPQPPQLPASLQPDLIRNQDRG